MLWALRFGGMKPDNERMVYHKYSGDPHNELAWSKRLPDALKFLLEK